MLEQLGSQPSKAMSLISVRKYDGRYGCDARSDMTALSCYSNVKELSENSSDVRSESTRLSLDLDVMFANRDSGRKFRNGNGDRTHIWMSERGPGTACPIWFQRSMTNTDLGQVAAHGA